MERRYPVIVWQFSLRPDSGGQGRYTGGNGIIRELEFRRPVQCSILSERRSYAPYGMDGGEDGTPGRNTWVSHDLEGREIRIGLGGKNSVPMKRGDRIIIETPGGGGYGSASGAVSGLVADADSISSPLSRANGSLASRVYTEQSN